MLIQCIKSKKETNGVYKSIKMITKQQIGNHRENNCAFICYFATICNCVS